MKVSPALPSSDTVKASALAALPNTALPLTTAHFGTRAHAGARCADSIAQEAHKDQLHAAEQAELSAYFARQGRPADAAAAQADADRHSARAQSRHARAQATATAAAAERTLKERYGRSIWRVFTGMCGLSMAVSIINAPIQANRNRKLQERVENLQRKVGHEDRLLRAQMRPTESAMTAVANRPMPTQARPIAGPSPVQSQNVTSSLLSQGPTAASLPPSQGRDAAFQGLTATPQTSPQGWPITAQATPQGFALAA